MVGRSLDDPAVQEALQDLRADSTLAGLLAVDAPARQIEIVSQQARDWYRSPSPDGVVTWTRVVTRIERFRGDMPPGSAD